MHVTHSVLSSMGISLCVLYVNMIMGQTLGAPDGIAQFLSSNHCCRFFSLFTFFLLLLLAPLPRPSLNVVFGCRLYSLALAHHTHVSYEWRGEPKNLHRQLDKKFLLSRHHHIYKLKPFSERALTQTW